MRFKILLLVFFLVLVSQVNAISFSDNFTGSNGDPPNSNNWYLPGAAENTAPEIQSNQVYFNAGGGGSDYSGMQMKNSFGDLHVIDLNNLNFLRLVLKIPSQAASSNAIIGLYPIDKINPRSEKSDQNVIYSVIGNNFGLYRGHISGNQLFDINPDAGDSFGIDINRLNDNVDLNVSFWRNYHIVYSTTLTMVDENLFYVWIAEGNGGDNFSGDDWEYMDANYSTGDNNRVVADFTYSSLVNLDPENGISSTTIDLNDSSLYVNTSPTNWYWLKDDVNISTDQNISISFSVAGDYNVCLHVFAVEDDTDEHDSWVCKTISVNQYPQDVNFTWTPIYPLKNVVKNVDANFFGDATDDDVLSKWFWQKNGEYWDNAQDTNTTFASADDFNVCLTVQDADDLNKGSCYELNVAGLLNIQFVDENTSVGVQVDLTINGVDYSDDVDSSGLLSLNLGGWTTTSYSFVAWDSTHSPRTWVLDLNQFSSGDYNFAVLDSNKGQTVTFLMKDENGTVLSDSRVYFYISGDKFAEIKDTDSDGRVQFFLNGNDANYTYSVQNGAETLDFNQTLVSVQVPEDEIYSTALTPFTVKVLGIGSREFANETSAVSFYCLPNTWEYYVINVSDGETYFARNYSLTFEGRPATYSLQPFLTQDTNGVLVWLYVSDIGGTTQPDVLVKSKKNLPVEGWTEIESRETDATGTVNLSFVSLDSYVLEFYQDHELLISKEFVPNATEFFVYLNLGSPAESYIVQVSPSISVLVSWFPSVSWINSLNGDVNFSQRVVNESSQFSVSSINVLIEADSNALIDVNYSSVGDLNQTVFLSDDVNGSLVVQATITITTSGGVIVKHKTWVVVWSAKEPYNLWVLLESLSNEMGEFVSLLIAVIVAILITGGMASIVRDTNGLAFVFCTILGIFAAIGWVSVFVFALVCAFAGGIVIVSKRDL